MLTSKKLSGTFGLRKIANADVLTPEYVSRLSALFGSLIQGKVAIGGDTRTTTPMIKHAIIAGLISSGCDVVDLGILPTPAVQYAVRNYYYGGIIVTASHNPPKYNGIKFVDKNGIGLKIEEINTDKEPKRASWKSIGKLFNNDKIIEEYIDEVLKRVDVEAIKKAGLKVVLDCGSGAGSEISPLIFRMAGCELITLNSQTDGFFPGRDPEPNEANLQDLMKIVVTTGADIGIAHDGDADRTICIDEKGNFVHGDKTFALVEKTMLKEKNENKAHKNSNNVIVTTVATSTAIYDIAEENNGKVITTAVGDPLVARKLLEENGLFGGEENGGLIFPDFAYGRDAALSAAKILEIIAKEKKKLSKLIAELPTYYSEKMKCDCEDEKKDYVMDKISKEVSTLGYKIDTTDGVKIFKNNGWLIIRPSGTEPIFRCFSESHTKEKAHEMAKWGISLIKKHISTYSRSSQ